MRFDRERQRFLGEVTVGKLGAVFIEQSRSRRDIVVLAKRSQAAEHQIRGLRAARHLLRRGAQRDLRRGARGRLDHHRCARRFRPHGEQARRSADRVGVRGFAGRFARHRRRWPRRLGRRHRRNTGDRRARPARTRGRNRGARGATVFNPPPRHRPHDDHGAGDRKRDRREDRRSPR